jgi:hypothetical protein
MLFFLIRAHNASPLGFHLPFRERNPVWNVLLAEASNFDVSHLSSSAKLSIGDTKL